MPVSDYQDSAEQLCTTCRRLGARGLCRATSGNFSLRVAEHNFLITKSGVEKSQLTPEQLMVSDIDGVAENPKNKPSAETPLHSCLYQLDDNTGAVLHTHSVTATVLSRTAARNLTITGYEMQKAIRGINSHEDTIVIPVFDNQQDMSLLVAEVEAAWEAQQLQACCFLIRGHGLYAWGADLAEAERHVDGIEFLLECMWALTTAELQ